MERSLNEGDPWSNLIIDFGADIGLDKSEEPLQETEIFGNNLLEVVGDFLPPSKFGHSREQIRSQRTVLEVFDDSSKCPCCNKNLELNAVESHAHVKTCFLEKQKGKGAQRVTLSSMALVDSIRSSVGKMDLRRRINLMESFNRLATMSGVKKETTQHQQQSQNISFRGQKSDHRVLSLLYSSKQSLVQSPVVRSASSELITPMGSSDKIFEYASLLSEAATPPLNPLLDPSYKTFTPLASPNSKPHPRMITQLKKRKVSQALSYSPKRFRSLITNI